MNMMALDDMNASLMHSIYFYEHAYDQNHRHFRMEMETGKAWSFFKPRETKLGRVFIN